MASKYGWSVLAAGLLLLALSGGCRAAEHVVYYHNDALGSPVAATNDSGEVLWSESYEPYGSRVVNPTDPNRLWYTGKPEESELGLTYFGARWYEPGIGRFHGIDPKDVEPGDVYSFNRYAYANDNPYKFMDPDGQTAIVVVSGSVTGFQQAYKDPNHTEPVIIPAYFVTAYHLETNERKDFTFTRDATLGGVKGKGDFGTGGEAPVGVHNGHIRSDNGRLQLYDRDVKQGNEPSKMKNPVKPDAPRAFLEFHGVGVGKGCLMSPKASDFNALIKSWVADDKANGRPEEVRVIIQWR